ncbi:hypothetical protein Hanom_Chr12g01117311 [Helianthus anomalus]
MLAAGFSATPSASNNKVALISQAGFQMFSSSASAKAAPAPANVHYSGTPAPALSSSTAATTSTNPVVKNEMIAFFTQQSKENLDITASVINYLNAFVAGQRTS